MGTLLDHLFVLLHHRLAKSTEAFDHDTVPKRRWRRCTRLVFRHQGPSGDSRRRISSLDRTLCTLVERRQHWPCRDSRARLPNDISPRKAAPCSIFELSPGAQDTWTESPSHSVRTVDKLKFAIIANALHLPLYHYIYKSYPQLSSPVRLQGPIPTK